MMMCDESQLQDWECDFCFFPVWPRRSREKESWAAQTARHLCVLSLASCVFGAFWAEWNRERLQCCFICTVFVWTDGMLVTVSSLWHTAWLWERSQWWQSVHGTTYVHLDESRSQESSSHPVPLKVPLPLTHFYRPHLSLQRFHLSQNSAINWGTFQTQTYRQQWWKVQWRKSVVGWM